MTRDRSSPSCGAASAKQVDQLLAWAAPFDADVGDRVRRRARLSARPSSSSPPASTSSMCRRRCRRGCGCWARDVRTRTTPTTRRSRSRRCGHRAGGGAGEDHTSVLRLLAKRTSTSAMPAAVRAAGCMRWCASWCRAGSAKKSLFHQAETLLARDPAGRGATPTARARRRDPRRDPPARRATEASKHGSPTAVTASGTT